jgi:glucosamine--fructose-6-phosphate aminotransferase (isomerizing)
MCGIVGYTGEKPAVPILLDGLMRLEYRGYDSAGLAVTVPGRGLATLKKAGKLPRLAAAARRVPWRRSVTTGIGHTRWATHGLPTDANAHPHTDCSGHVALAHNGIIENHAALRADLARRGHRFRSQTDSEVLAHLLEEGLKRRAWPAAVRWALSRIEGTYSIVALWDGDPRTLIGARSGGGALVVGLGRGGQFLASDVPALLGHTRQVLYLADGEMAVVNPGGATVTAVADGRSLPKRPARIEWSAEQAEKGGHPHFMLKEILEQPRALEDTFTGRLDPANGRVFLDLKRATPAFMRRCRRITLLACGTSFYAAQVGKFLFEKYLRIPTEVDYASEYRYRDPVRGGGHLAVVITQSGETVDTLVALREARRMGARVLSICNVMGSSATREADDVLLTRAGPEIGVASTKAFTTQLAALWLLTLQWARDRGDLPLPVLRRKALSLARIPAQAALVLREAGRIAAVARRLARHRDFLFLGRGINYPIALEGALKLKEISYVHAEGYPGGEMKHGPIALIDQRMPVVAIALRGSKVYEKMLNNMEEVRARRGRLIAVAERRDPLVARKAASVFWVPPVDEDLSPILSIIPLQVFAYEVAKNLGREIDQPRNLAKSVTVE